MCRLGPRPRYSFSGNICFEISVFCLCSVHDSMHVPKLTNERYKPVWQYCIISQKCFEFKYYSRFFQTFLMRKNVLEHKDSARLSAPCWQRRGHLLGQGSTKYKKNSLCLYFLFSRACETIEIRNLNSIPQWSIPNLLSLFIWIWTIKCRRYFVVCIFPCSNEYRIHLFLFFIFINFFIYFFNFLIYLFIYFFFCLQFLIFLYRSWP